MSDILNLIEEANKRSYNNIEIDFTAIVTFSSKLITMM